MISFFQGFTILAFKRWANRNWQKNDQADGVGKHAGGIAKVKKKHKVIEIFVFIFLDIFVIVSISILILVHVSSLL